MNDFDSDIVQQIYQSIIGNRKEIPDSGQYKTQLSPQEESEFQSWVKENKIPWEESPTADYDMRGFWRAMKAGQPLAVRGWDPNDQKWHFPDTWKTPYHRTFSVESIYATAGAPHWEGGKLIDKNGRTLFDDRMSAKQR